MYGYTSANFSGRMPLSELACAIVADSRLCTEVAIDAVKDKFGFSTVYGDTDSLFVDLEQPLTKETLNEAIQKAKHIAKEVTKLFDDPIQLKYEKVYWPCILESKKRYFGLMWEDEYKDGAFPFEAKGIETVRRDGVTASAKLLVSTARALFEASINGEEVVQQQMRSRLLTEFTKMLSDPARFLPDVMFQKGWRGLDNYAEDSKTGPVRIAQIMLNKDPDLVPKRHSRVSYAIRKQNANRDDETLFDRSLPMMDFVNRLEQPDIRYYLEKQIGPAVDRFTGVVQSVSVDLGELIEEAELRANSAKLDTDKCFICKKAIAPDLYICPKCRTPDNEYLLGQTLLEFDNELAQSVDQCRKCIGDATDSSFFSSMCVNVDCSNLFKIHYLTHNRRNYFLRKTKDKIQNVSATSFEQNRIGNFVYRKFPKRIPDDNNRRKAFYFV